MGMEKESLYRVWLNKQEDMKSNFLVHYGISGQKWGIRRYQNEDRSLTRAGKERYRKVKEEVNKRYQNEDGSLTEKGRKRVAQAGLYMQPDIHRATKRFGRIDDTNRRKIREENQKDYWAHHDELYERPHKLSDKYHEMWDSYKTRYASATLKDLKLKDNKKARAEVKSILKSIDPDYDSRKDLEWEDRKAYEQRRNNLIHPGKEKIKRVSKHAKSVVDTAVNVRKLIG